MPGMSKNGKSPIVAGWQAVISDSPALSLTLANVASCYITQVSHGSATNKINDLTAKNYTHKSWQAILHLDWI